VESFYVFCHAIAVVFQAKMGLLRLGCYIDDGGQSASNDTAQDDRQYDRPYSLREFDVCRINPNGNAVSRISASPLRSRLRVDHDFVRQLGLDRETASGQAARPVDENDAGLLSAEYDRRTDGACNK
jgi:hypothetical protein